MGDAAAVLDHHRRRAPAAQAPQGLGRIDAARPDRALTPFGWLEVFARIGAGVRSAVIPIAGTAEGRAQLAVGAGGDTTMELDARAERVVFGELANLTEHGEKFSVLSEEAGLRSFGAEFPLVLVDPVDGSLNAKQGVPLFGLMLAVLDGPMLADAYAGLVLNLNTGEEWTAVRKQGARRDGRPVHVLPRSDGKRLELLGLESTPRALKMAHPLVERASKIRVLGSMALSIALTSAGAFDVFCAPIPVRVFDTAASLLILQETGGAATTIEGQSLGRLNCDLSTRATLICAPSRELHAEALRILEAGRGY